MSGAKYIRLFWQRVQGADLIKIYQNRKKLGDD